MEFGSMVHAAQPIPLAHSDSLTQISIQFTRQPPRFSSILETLVPVQDASVLCEEISVLLAKYAIDPVPPAKMVSGFTALTLSWPTKTVAFGQSWIWILQVDRCKPVLGLDAYDDALLRPPCLCESLLLWSHTRRKPLRAIHITGSSIVQPMCCYDSSLFAEKTLQRCTIGIVLSFLQGRLKCHPPP